MMRLNYFSAKAIETLRASIQANLKNYTSEGFDEFVDEPDWTVSLSLEVDLGPLGDLDPSGTPQAEIENSILVWRALSAVKPSLAYEEGIWTRLTHVECLGYSRQRWLEGLGSQEKIESAIGKHFFAPNLGGRRDDNALARLWFNGYIANQIARDDFDSLKTILRRADSRLSFLERSLTVSRPAIAAGVIRASEKYDWINSTQSTFRDFMKVLNKLGGGRVFEVMTEAEVDEFMTDCALRAGMPSS